MLKLRTLGGLDLRDAQDRKVSAVLAHPKRASLLVYLTLASPRGVHRRDTLIAMFWPESNQDLARASLRKALHNLRRTLGEGAIVSTGDDAVGLSPDLLSCDALELEQAADAGEAETAHELYKGPVLDGFHLPDAPEFERWVERERARMRERAFQNAWSQAVREEARGAPSEAVAWARKAFAVMPDDERALRGLVAMLDRIGDRAGALSAYEEFAARRARDLEAEPAAETLALVARIKSPPPLERAPEVSRPAKALDARIGFSPGVPVALLTARFVRRLFAKRSARAIGGLLLVLLAGWRMWRFYEASASTVSPIATSVLPFTFRGAPALAYLAGGMPALLETSLDGVGMQTADSANARYHVTGAIVEAGGHLRVSAELRDDDKRVVARASAEDSSSRIFSVVDRLAAQLVAFGSAERQERLTELATVTTSSLPALRAYLEGEASFRIGHYKEAVDKFRRAVLEDSTFALAYYRLAVAYGSSSDTLSRPTARRAVSLSRRLTASDRMLVEAYAAYAHGDADDAERRYRAIVRLRPFDGEAWYQLGEVLFYFNGIRGRPIEEARPAFQRALANGPRDAVLTHLLEIEAIDWNYGTFDSLIAGINAGSHFDLVGRTVHAFTKGSDASRARVIAENRKASDHDLADYARHALFLLSDRRHADRVVRLLLDPVRPAEVRALGHSLLAHLEASAGRLHAADTELRFAEALDRTRALEHRGLLESLPFLAIPHTQRLGTREALEEPPPDVPGGDAVFSEGRELHSVFRQYLVGLLSAEIGELDRARKIADELERAGARDESFAGALGAGIEARVFSLQDRPADALRSLHKNHESHVIDELLGVVPFFGQGTERFLRAELLRELGRNEEALSWYGSFGQHSAYDRVYLAPAHRRMAEILLQMGRRAEAVRHYEKFVTLWRDCDPELRPLVDAARAQLVKLR